METVHIPIESDIKKWIKEVLVEYFDSQPAEAAKTVSPGEENFLNRKQVAGILQIKRSQAPSVSKGFHLGCEDIKATKRFIVYPGKERFPVTKEITAIPILSMMNELTLLKSN